MEGQWADAKRIEHVRQGPGDDNPRFPFVFEWRGTHFRTVPVTKRLEEYQREFGYSPHSLVSLTANTHSWIAPDGSGAVVYLPIGHTWLAAEPMGLRENLERLTREFVGFARNNMRLPAFLPVTARMASLSERLGMDCVPIGMSPYCDLQEWNLSGRRRHALRAGVNQARRAGVSVDVVAAREAPFAELERLCGIWNEGRRTSTFGWVFAPDVFSFPEQKTMFLARNRSHDLIGFLTASPMPARECCYLEDVQRVPDAPKGATDLLIVTAIEHLREKGIRFATLGTVPLFGVDRVDALHQGQHDTARRVLHAVFAHGSAIYNFAGVHRFKARMDPTWWEHEYVMAPPEFMMAPRVAAAAVRAIAAGGVFGALLNATWRRERE